MTISLLDPKFALNILIHVAILFTILSIFFSVIISKMASNAINKELEHAIKHALTPDKWYKDKLNETAKDYGVPFLPTELLKNVNSHSFDYYLKLFSKEDRTRLAINNELYDKIRISNIIIVVFTVIITLLFVFNNVISFGDLQHILIDNVTTFTFVGIIEVLFFLFIALKFVPAPPSLIVTSFIKNMKDRF